MRSAGCSMRSDWRRHSIARSSSRIVATPGMLPRTRWLPFAPQKQNGADFAEIDVRLTKDGIPVVFHDRRTGRLDAGGRNVLVNSMPLSALQRMIMQQRGMRYSVPRCVRRWATLPCHVRGSGGSACCWTSRRTRGMPESGRCRGACGRGFQIRRQSDGDVGQPVCGDGLQEHASAVACRPVRQRHTDLTQWGDDGTSEARFMDGGRAGRDRAPRSDGEARRKAAKASHVPWNARRGHGLRRVPARGTSHQDCCGMRGCAEFPVYVDSVDSYDAANGLLRHGVSGLLGENITPLQQACSSYHGLPGTVLVAGR